MRIQDTIEATTGHNIAEFQAIIQDTLERARRTNTNNAITPGSLEIGNIVLLGCRWKGYECNSRHYTIVSKTNKGILVADKQDNTWEHPAHNLIQVKGYKSRRCKIQPRIPKVQAHTSYQRNHAYFYTRFPKP